LLNLMVYKTSSIEPNWSNRGNFLVKDSFYKQVIKQNIKTD